MGAGPIAWRRLDAEDPGAWAWLPTFVKRVTSFAARYGSEGTADGLQRYIETHFVARSSRLGAWAIWRLSEDHASAARMIGHVLASIEDRIEMGVTTRRWGFIAQIEADEPLAAAIRRDLLADALAWAAAHQATDLEMASKQPSRLWKRYGFTPHRVIYRRAVPAPVQKDVSDGTVSHHV